MFKPNVINSVVFLLSTTVQANAFLCNYRVGGMAGGASADDRGRLGAVAGAQGAPFMEGLVDNVPLCRAICITYAVVIVAVLEISADITELLQLVAFPTEMVRVRQPLAVTPADATGRSSSTRFSRSFWPTAPQHSCGCVACARSSELESSASMFSINTQCSQLCHVHGCVYHDIISRCDVLLYWKTTLRKSKLQQNARGDIYMPRTPGEVKSLRLSIVRMRCPFRVRPAEGACELTPWRALAMHHVNTGWSSWVGPDCARTISCTASRAEFTFASMAPPAITSQCGYQGNTAPTRSTHRSCECSRMGASL